MGVSLHKGPLAFRSLKSRISGGTKEPRAVSDGTTLLFGLLGVLVERLADGTRVVHVVIWKSLRLSVTMAPASPTSAAAATCSSFVSGRLKVPSCGSEFLTTASSKAVVIRSIRRRARTTAASGGPPRFVRG